MREYILALLFGRKCLWMLNSLRLYGAGFRASLRMTCRRVPLKIEMLITCTIRVVVRDSVTRFSQVATATRRGITCGSLIVWSYREPTSSCFLWKFPPRFF